MVCDGRRQQGVRRLGYTFDGEEKLPLVNLRNNKKNIIKYK
jgi:hypothetical protein